ncbi:MAG: tetratricopeptide repeat protein, partial [Verrucomicrobiota bacterium]
AKQFAANGEDQKALEIYQALAEKRPHLLQIKRTIAQLYTDSGDFKKATDLYEQLIKANPNMYQQLSWELRNIYQRSGKGKELEKMEDKLMAKARDPNQLSNLASQMQNDGEIEKAIELWRRVIKLSPGQSYYQSQLASLLVQQGQLDEALKLFQEWLDSPSTRSQGWVDYGMLKQLAGLYRATGKLEELKTHCEADLKKNSGDMIAKALQTQIALLEKRFDDAFLGFKASVETGRDPNVLSELISFADISGKIDEVLELAKNDSLKNAWDSRSLARLYFAKGDLPQGEETLLQWADQQMQQGNGSWAVQEALQQLGEFNRWEAAEKFVRKHRTDPMQQYEAEQMDRQVAESYIKDNHYQSLVDEVMQKGAFKGRDLDLMKRIGDQYQSSGDNGARDTFLEKLHKADPSNRDLTYQLASKYNTTTDLPKKLALFQKLATEEPNTAKYREGYTAALIYDGHAEEALKELAVWTAAKPLEARYSLLGKEQKLAGRFRAARESMLKAIEVADTSRKAELNLALAEFDAQRGDREGWKNALIQNFEKRKDAPAFQRYLTYLQQQGYPQEAYAFVTNNADKGFFDRYRGTDFLALCLDENDYKTPMELTWQFTRYGERWSRDSAFDPAMNFFEERAKLPMLLEDFRKRIDAESPKHRGLLEKLAQSYTRAGLTENALEIYDRLLALSPFNRGAVNGKAQLLVKLNRGDDAVALLRDAKGITSLNEELEAKFQLISTLLELKRGEDAEKEIAGVLAWAKGSALLERIGQIYFGQKNYAKAAEFLEKSRKFQHGESFNQLRGDLGKCYVKLGREPEALQLWGELVTSNKRPVLDGIQSWLMTEKHYEVAAKLSESRVKANPQEANLYYLLADSLQHLGKTNEAFDTLVAAEKTLPESKAESLRAELANLIRNNQLTEAALQHLEKTNSPLLVTALIRIVAGPNSQKEQILRVAKFAAAQTVTRGNQILLGDALAKLKLNAEAAEWYHKALAGSNSTQRISAARGLVNVGAGAEASNILGEWLKTNPQDFATDTNLWIAVGKTADPVLWEQFNQARTNFSLSEAENNFYLMVLQHFGGKTNEAKALLPALTQAMLSPVQLRLMNFICEEEGLLPQKLEILNRLASGGYGATTLWQANADLVKAYARQGDLNKAVQTYSKMFPVCGQPVGEEARVALADAVTAQNFSAFKNAILEIVRQKTDHDRVSSLLGLCSQVAQRIGVDQTAIKLADELQLTGTEKNETAVWDELLENWEISPSFQLDNPETAFPPEQEYLSKTKESSPLEKTAWKKTDPKQELGVLRVDEFLGLADNERSRKVAYARTTIDSA